MNTKPTHGLSVEERFELERRWFRRALGIALLLHVVFFALWRAAPNLESPYAAAGPRAGDDLAAAGGSMQAVQMQVQATRPIRPPPVPLLTIEPDAVVEFEDEPAQEMSDLLGEAPTVALGAGEGDREGPGKAEGEGQGDGGTGDEGRFRLNPPIPRGMIMPPTNEDLRGKQVEVWVFVDVNGRVVADSTYLVPPTGDRSYNERLRSEAAEWVFRPATRDGKAVAAWFPYTISM